MSDGGIAATSPAVHVRARTRSNDSDGGRIGAWGLALVFAVSWIFRFLSTTSFHNDQYMHLAWANQVLGGDWPIRDFVDPGMPLTYLVSAAAQVLLGRGAWAEAVLSFTLLSIGAALTCHLAARASGSRLIGVAAALIQVVIAPRLYSAPKIVLPLWALWACWHYNDRPTRRSLAGLAACAATAFLVRHDHGAYIGLAAVALLLTHHWPKSARPVLTYSSCVALMLVPFFMYVQWNGGIIDYFQTGLAFRDAEYSGRQVVTRPGFDFTRVKFETPQINIRWSPTIDTGTRVLLEAEHGLENPAHVHERTWRYRLTDSSPGNVQKLIKRPEIEDTAGIDRTALRVSGMDETMLDQLSRAAGHRGANWVTAVLKRENAVAWMYLLFTWLPALALLLLGVAWLRAWPGLRTGAMPAPVVVAAIVLAAATNQGFLRDPLDVRLADASAATLILAAWLAGQVHWRRAGMGNRRRMAVSPSSVLAAAALAIAVAAASAAFLSAAELGSLNRALEESRIAEGPRVMARKGRQTISAFNARPPIDSWLASGDQQHLKELTRYVRECTRPDDRLLVTWFAPEVYFYSERKFSAGLGFFYQGFFVSQAGEDVALARLRSQRVPIALAEVSTFEQFFVRDHPRLAAYLAERYIVAGEVSAPEGTYRVLVDRRAIPLRTASPWSLPCFA